MKQIFLVGTIGLILIISACHSPKKLNGAAQPLIRYAKGPCFGMCPQFQLDVYAEGLVLYQGFKNTPLTGSYTVRLSRRDLKAWKQWFKVQHFEDLPEMINMEIMDAPVTTIVYKTKTVKAKGTLTPSLQKINDSLNHYLNHLPWTLIAPSMDDHTIRNEIIVQLAPEISVQTWLRDFIAYGLYLKETISTASNQHVVSYQAGEQDPLAVFLAIYHHRMVKKAEFNKILDLR